MYRKDRYEPQSPQSSKADNSQTEKLPIPSISKIYPNIFSICILLEPFMRKCVCSGCCCTNQSFASAAVEKKVFGSPFVVIDGEPFFGVDRLPQIAAKLAGKATA